MQCRPLGPSNEWLIQKKTALPYNIRNYQAKLVFISSSVSYLRPATDSKQIVPTMQQVAERSFHSRHKP